MGTFCMGDPGIVSGYRADADGRTEPVLLPAGMIRQEHRGFGCRG